MPHPVLTNGGTSAEWALENPILPTNTTGTETDTLRAKIGNGSSYWNSLKYTPEKIDRLISVEQFRNRFTDQETTDFLTAAKTDINVEKLYWKLATRRELLNLDSTDIVAGVDYLISISVLQSGRKQEILS